MDVCEFWAYFAPAISEMAFEGTHATVNEPKLIICFTPHTNADDSHTALVFLPETSMAVAIVQYLFPHADSFACLCCVPLLSVVYLFDVCFAVAVYNLEVVEVDVGEQCCNDEQYDAFQYASRYLLYKQEDDHDDCY